MAFSLQEMFVNFSKSHCLCFIHLNMFFCEWTCRFLQTLKWLHGTRQVKNHCFRGNSCSIIQVSRYTWRQHGPAKHG